MSWPAFWTDNRWQSKLLAPLAKLVCWEASRRLRNFQQHPPLRQTSACVIVVGNIVVGGSGKTPFIVWLAKQLQAEGLKVGIISRGYGGRYSHEKKRAHEGGATDEIDNGENAQNRAILVSAQSDPQRVGDEPVLLAKQLGCLIAVSPKRARAIELLNQHATLDVIISDDGLQHYAMARDIEVVLIDAQRQFGNQRCLPAGPLREPMGRLQQVDFCIWNGLGVNEDFPSLSLTNASFAKVPFTTPTSHFKMDLTPLCFRQVMNSDKTLPVNAFEKQEVNAIAGIGHPQRFFETLQTLQVVAHGREFADHYAYTVEDFADFDDAKPLLMTEKDAVKCSQMAQAHQKSNWWYLEVAPLCEAETLTDDAGQPIRTELFTQILQRLHRT